MEQRCSRVSGHLVIWEILARRYVSNYDEKKSAQNVCEHSAYKRIELEGPGWSGFEED